MRIQLRWLSLFFLISSFSWGHSKTIIWDLGGVLFKQNRFGVASSIGLGRFASYALFDWRNPNIHSLLFTVLNSLGEQQGIDCHKVRDEKGNPLPQIMCDWLMGKVAPHVLIDRAHNHIELLHQQSYFISMREKELLKESIRVIFDPEHFAYHNRPVNPAIKLLEDCASFYDDQGKPKHE